MEPFKSSIPIKGISPKTNTFKIEKIATKKHNFSNEDGNKRKFKFERLYNKCDFSIFGYSLDILWNCSVQDLVSMKDGAVENLKNAGSNFTVQNTVFLMFSLCEIRSRNIVITLTSKQITNIIDSIKKYYHRIVYYLQTLLKEEFSKEFLRLNDLILIYYMGSCDKSNFMNCLIERFESVYDIFKANFNLTQPLSSQSKLKEEKNEKLLGKKREMPDFIQDNLVNKKLINIADTNIINANIGKTWNLTKIMTDLNEDILERERIEQRLRNLNDRNEKPKRRQRVYLNTSSANLTPNIKSINHVKDMNEFISDSISMDLTKNIFNTHFLDFQFDSITSIFGNNFNSKKRENKDERQSGRYNFSSSLI